MMDAKEIGDQICKLINTFADIDCKDCIFSDRCYSGHNGAVDYIKEFKADE